MNAMNRPANGQQLRWNHGDTVDFTIPLLHIYTDIVLDLA
jgi:hypothetical protein